MADPPRPPPAAVPPPPAGLAPAWYQGREALYADHALADCPYGDGTADRDAWIAGYQAAERFRQVLDDHLKHQS